LRLGRRPGFDLFDRLLPRFDLAMRADFWYRGRALHQFRRGRRL
jgi:hypothetical protein